MAVHFTGSASQLFAQMWMRGGQTAAFCTSQEEEEKKQLWVVVFIRPREDWNNFLWFFIKVCPGAMFCLCKMDDWQSRASGHQHRSWLKKWPPNWQKLTHVHTAGASCVGWDTLWDFHTLTSLKRLHRTACGVYIFCCASPQRSIKPVHSVKVNRLVLKCDMSRVNV